ncbi:hypothetical protein PGT21_013742 [Puccinia graminis f. sp. tritici]|uniref:Uncharacterized protein n=1 Tax=Puccinia graminis f. sp. tritici TaxID=56615 RepID=A0A5B0NMY0_PUCGR|nr:hypothetical protein PGT21_013742 [Puccinia graminis f. sp. tritici]KAA1089906.1 hypothetical protein PGTUg99_029017 [Puccinia graminis f. sp. tritici]
MARRKNEQNLAHHSCLIKIHDIFKDLSELVIPGYVRAANSNAFEAGNDPPPLKTAYCHRLGRQQPPPYYGAKVVCLFAIRKPTPWLRFIGGYAAVEAGNFGSPKKTADVEHLAS